MGSIGHRSCKGILKDKTALMHYFVCLQMHNKILPSADKVFYNFEKYLFLKKYVTSEGAVSHNILFYQQLSIARLTSTFFATIISCNYQKSRGAFNHKHKIDLLAMELSLRIVTNRLVYASLNICCV